MDDIEISHGDSVKSRMWEVAVIWIDIHANDKDDTSLCLIAFHIPHNLP